MASANSTTFGASIVPIEHRYGDNTIPQLSAPDSPSITPAPSHEDLRTSTHPQQSSPVYQNPTALKPIHAQKSSKPSYATNEKDLEAGASTPLSADDENPFTSKVSVDINKECAMWPSKQTLMQNKEAEKKRKREGKHCGGCAPVVDAWARFDKRKKLTIKIVIGLFLLGVAVAIGVGISVAVNGTVYVSEDQSQQIPDPERR